MKIKKILSVILSLILLNSCTGFSDAIQGKKRSENSDEFLVQKKNPLTAPPDMDELPVPSDQEKRSEEISVDDSDKIKKALNIESNKTEDNNNTNNKKNIEKLILEKINN
tara:strand:- start:2968 stop:3297 length:330 start_codon:yes stop_codon:yes gene_type:complete